MKVSIPGFIYTELGLHAEQGNYRWARVDMGGVDGYATVCQHTLEFDMPQGFDPRSLQVQALAAEKVKLMAAFHARCTEIERKISELTCLEMAA